ncbi:peptidase C39 family protein [Micromonospora sp. 15K316]|uniref:peptidase C39 family protein n=1 Tax=Micromonospora sp. 15K316 TaxID=2530376 RepID=UPI00104E9221|nr:peptidase C39 family protein [Micromonospora sp. 15K316]TDC32270.1 peptidase C39 family protein [Micromonospora sp. 15K316]
MTTAAPPRTRDIAYRGFRLPGEEAAGVGVGLRAEAHGLLIGEAAGVRPGPAGDEGRYEWGSWTAPPVPVGFPVGEVVPSWTALTPDGCWIEVELRGWHGDGPATGWYVLGRWAADDRTVRRGSVPGQRDGAARVETDTLVIGAATVTGWQLRVTLLRPAGGGAGPVLRTVGAVATGRPGTAPPDTAHRPTSATDGPDPAPVEQSPGRPGDARGVVLDVPRYAQRLHGPYPQWGGGGDSWCSPTCTSMVLAFWGAAPPARRYAWVDPPGPRPVVVHAARHCYDHAYGGAGNWAFNTAYAGLHGVDAFVTRLRSLAEAEAFIAAGIPLVVSAAFRAGEVPGLAYDTRGHLIVLVGFTSDGDPVLNDPYAENDEAVRRIVRRDRFEAVWQRGSGGMAYVIRPSEVALPPAPAQANW